MEKVKAIVGPAEACAIRLKNLYSVYKTDDSERWQVLCQAHLISASYSCEFCLGKGISPIPWTEVE